MKKVVLLTAVSLLLPRLVHAQGCSDAGVCTAGAVGELHLWQDSMPDPFAFRHSARPTYSYASGEQNTTISQVQAELNIGLTHRLSLQAKIPFVWTAGALGDNSGIGDAVVAVSYAFIKEIDRGLSGMLGMRLPTGSTDARAPLLADTGNHVLVALDVGSLPMPYQTGLGTTDLLAGVEWRHEHWVAALAYQHVLGQNNKNTFSPEAWSNDPRASGYFGSRALERADDAVARAQYVYGCGRLALQPGFLAIYHVKNDTRLETDMAADPMLHRVTVEGSQGLTLNGTLDLRFKLNAQWALEASAGMPFVTREARPDGLTREFVVSGGVRFRF